MLNNNDNNNINNNNVCIMLSAILAKYIQGPFTVKLYNNIKYASGHLKCSSYAINNFYTCSSLVKLTEKTVNIKYTINVYTLINPPPHTHTHI